MTNMRLTNLKTVLTILFVLSSTMSFAQHSILKTNDSDLLRIDGIYAPGSNNQIKIDGKWRSMKSNQKDRIITPNSKIELKGNEYIVFTNLRTGQGQQRICGADFESTNTSTIAHFVQRKNAGTKGGNNIDNYRDFIERYSWYMIEDTLYIPTHFMLDDNHGFSMQLLFSDIVLMGVPVDTTTSELVITKDFIEKDSMGNDTGIKLEPDKEYAFGLFYYNYENKIKVADRLVVRCISQN